MFITFVVNLLVYTNGHFDYPSSFQDAEAELHNRSSVSSRPQQRAQYLQPSNTNNTQRRNLQAFDYECCDFTNLRSAQSSDGCAVICPITTPGYRSFSCDGTEKQTVCIRGEAKSGTTWTEYLVSGLMEIVCHTFPGKCRFERTKVEQHITDKSEDYSLFMGPENRDFRVVASAFDNARTPGCFKHHAAHKGPQNYGQILVIRDARDVAVSRYYYTGQKGSTVPLQYVRTKFAEHQTWIRKWTNFAHGLRSAREGALLVVRYEELNANNPVVLRQVHEFLHLDCAAPFEGKYGDHVFEKFAFSKLTQQEEEGGVIGAGVRRGSTKKMRKGQSFGFGDHLRPEDLRKLEAAMRDNILFSNLYWEYYAAQQRRRQQQQQEEPGGR